MSGMTDLNDFDFTLSGIDLSDVPAFDEETDVLADISEPEEALPEATLSDEEGDAVPDLPAPDETPVDLAKTTVFSGPLVSKAAEEPAEAEEDPFLPEEESEPKEETGKSRRHGGLITLLVVLGLLLAVAVAGFLLYKDIYVLLQAELGSGLPDASYFMRDGSHADYVAPPEISLKEEQLYLLTLDTERGSRKVLLLVKDEEAPAAEDAHLSVVYGTHVNPADVLTPVDEASAWVSRWVQAPDYETLGSCVVSVELRDAFGNTAVIPATLEITAPVHSCTWPIGEERPDVSEFLINGEDNAWFDESYSAINWELAGSYPLTVYVNGKAYETELILTAN